MSKYKTAESVSPKHPDKICDQIADAILDAYLMGDPLSRVAIEVTGGHGVIFVIGEVTSKLHNIDFDKIISRLAPGCKIIKKIKKQSPEIARGVDAGGYETVNWGDGDVFLWHEDLKLMRYQINQQNSPLLPPNTGKVLNNIQKLSDKFEYQIVVSLITLGISIISIIYYLVFLRRRKNNN